MEEQTKTEVTSVAKEEEKTGEKIDVPDPETLVKLAHSSFNRCKLVLGNLFPDLSAKAKNRVFFAALDMPTDGIPVFLQTDKEKVAFATAQRMLADRFIILQDHIYKEYKNKQNSDLAAKKSVDVLEQTVVS